MPTYPVKNLKTGETQELSMTMSAYDKWREENPDWDKDWSKGCAGVGEVGEWQEKLIKRKPGWNDVLGKVSKMPGANVKPFSV
tara:strand:+ start:181 stop:429 length:249 start_codon:yes stop_codon:yes gene_type:complete